MATKGATAAEHGEHHAQREHEAAKKRRELANNAVHLNGPGAEMNRVVARGISECTRLVRLIA